MVAVPSFIVQYIVKDIQQKQLNVDVMMDANKAITLLGKRPEKNLWL